MPQSVAIPLALAGGSKILDKVMGGGGVQAQLPKDMQAMRGNVMGLTNYLLGFGPDPRVGMAGGGMVMGPGGPKDDAIPAKLSNGEGVLTAEAVQAIGGEPVVNFLNMLGIMKLLQAQPGDGSGMPAGQPQAGGMPMAPQHFANGGIAVNPTSTSSTPMVPAGSAQGVFQGPGTMSNTQSGWGAPMPTGPAQQAPISYGPNSPYDSSKQAVPPPPKDPLAYINWSKQYGQAYKQQGGPSGGPKPIDRLESYYGQLGVPATPLQQQATGGIQQFLASDPYAQARTALEGILGNPGEAYRPDFERSLAQANQTGGRFGSANALMRSQALNDYNAQTLQQQIAASQGLQNLGTAQMQNLIGGYGVGQSQAAQDASRQQQAIQLQNQLLQTAQGATFGAPTAQQPSFFQDVLGGAGAWAQVLPYLSGGGGGGSQPGYTNNNWIYNR